MDVVLEIGILDLSLSYIKNYPDEAIDSQVFISSLNLVSYIIQADKK
jgi:hypothetical protein